MKKAFDPSSSEWLIKEKGYDPAQQGLYETLLTLGNGYMCQRAALEENPLESYRGAYIAGLFDKSESLVPEIVKVPGWTDISVWHNGARFGVDNCAVLSHERALDMRKGILYRSSRLKNKAGKIIRLETKRVLFAHQVRGGFMEITVIPENFSGELKVISGLNGEVTNMGHFPNERIKHLNLKKIERTADHIYLEMETRDKNIRLALASKMVFEDAPKGTAYISKIYGEKCSQEYTFKAMKKNKYSFNKWTSIYTSREGYERQLESAATDTLSDMIRDGIDYHLNKHLEWREKQWQQADVMIKGDKLAQKGLRFNIYHLLIARPHHDPTVSIGAKFLTGEGYKGHAFWDTEIFILPFYIYNFPEDARNLLMYRYYTLNGAQQNARHMGYKGAKYAWESADTGIETTPTSVTLEDGSKIRIFTGDEEHHIVSDVIHGLFDYYYASGDNDFMLKYGAEMLFLTAKFWMSRVEKRRDRYEIRKVIGPDEFHEHVDNNAFTNYLVILHFEKAVEIYESMKKEYPDMLKQLLERIKVSQDDFELMKKMSKTIYFPYDQKSELIEQFEGYFSLRDIKPGKLNREGFPEFPPGVSGDNVDRTQLIKQADVVLMLHLFVDRFSPELKKKNFHYYEARTLHKSSLSPCIYAMMGLEVGDHKKAY
ncbi:MAG: glycoside hydrolase family 65 protein, partial [Candidatus Margulisiibacteriota bacterium]